METAHQITTELISSLAHAVAEHHRNDTARTPELATVRFLQDFQAITLDRAALDLTIDTMLNHPRSEVRAAAKLAVSIEHRDPRAHAAMQLEQQLAKMQDMVPCEHTDNAIETLKQYVNDPAFVERMIRHVIERHEHLDSLMVARAVRITPHSEKQAAIRELIESALTENNSNRQIEFCYLPMALDASVPSNQVTLKGILEKGQRLDNSKFETTAIESLLASHDSKVCGDITTQLAAFGERPSNVRLAMAYGLRDLITREVAEILLPIITSWGVTAATTITHLQGHRGLAKWIESAKLLGTKKFNEYRIEVAVALSKQYPGPAQDFLRQVPSPHEPEKLQSLFPCRESYARVGMQTYFNITFRPLPLGMPK